MRIAATFAPPFAACGIAVQRGGEAPVFDIATAPEIGMTPETMWRAASISKVVTGAVVRAVLAQSGTSPDAEVGDILGLPLRNPAHPGVPVTVAQVASHQAGLTDAGGYAVPPHVTLGDWLGGRAIWGDAAPGARFDYCNLGYILIAAVAERLSGESFDVLSRRLVLDPLGVGAGFNWAGVLAARRADALPTYRRGVGGFMAQIDAEVPPYGIVCPGARDPAPSATTLAPQGGLRLSLRGALTLARSLRDVDAAPLWSGPSPAPFESYGWGLMIHDAPPFYPRPLIGHFASAYGMAGGIWYDRAADIAFAHVLNGLPEGDEADDLRPEELAIFDAVAQSVA